jgi:hypothetical protein
MISGVWPVLKEGADGVEYEMAGSIGIRQSAQVPTILRADKWYLNCIDITVGRRQLEENEKPEIQVKEHLNRNKR